MDKILGYLGIARKGGYLATGEENSGAAVRSGGARVLMLASDASDNAVSRAKGFVRGGKTPLITLPFTKEELSEATGQNGCSMVALTDVGLASAVLDALAALDGEKFAETAAELKIKKEKASRRRAEAAAHERNKRAGKRRNTK